MAVPNLRYKINLGINRGIREETIRWNVTPAFVDFHNNVHLEVRLEQLIELARPHGVFCFNDQCALVGLRQLYDLGVDVPGEVKSSGATTSKRLGITVLR